MEPFCSIGFPLGCLSEDVLIEGRSFWQLKILQACSWTWRKLLKLKDETRGFFEI